MTAVRLTRRGRNLLQVARATRTVLLLAVLMVVLAGAGHIGFARQCVDLALTDPAQHATTCGPASTASR